MANDQITVRVGVRWWVWFYLDAIKAFCWSTGAEPDADRVAAFIIKHGIWLKSTCKRGGQDG